MPGIGIAVEELDGALGPGLHHCVVDRAAGEHRAHGQDAVGDRLGGGHQVGNDAKMVGRKGCSQPPEAGDHLVENQQDAVSVTDGAQPLQIAQGRRQHTR